MSLWSQRNEAKILREKESKVGKIKQVKHLKKFKDSEEEHKYESQRKKLQMLHCSQVELK